MEKIATHEQSSAREYIGTLLEHLNAQFQASESERRLLYDQEREQEDDSILDTLEMLKYNLTGYAAQIRDPGRVVAGDTLPLNNPAAFLRELQMFDKPFFLTWYRSANPYPLLRAYADMLDHLRLLIIDYIQKHQAEHQANAEDKP